MSLILNIQNRKPDPLPLQVWTEAGLKARMRRYLAWTCCLCIILWYNLGMAKGLLRQLQPIFWLIVLGFFTIWAVYSLHLTKLWQAWHKCYLHVSRDYFIWYDGQKRHLIAWDQVKTMYLTGNNWLHLSYYQKKPKKSNLKTDFELFKTVDTVPNLDNPTIDLKFPFVLVKNWNNFIEYFQTLPRYSYSYHSLARFLWFKVFLPISLALAIQTTMVSLHVVQERSMMPTLVPGDTVLLNRLAFGLWLPSLDWTFTSLPESVRLPRVPWHMPQRGSLIVFRHPARMHPQFPEKGGATMIKRVLAIAGDMFAFKTDGLYINGQKVSEPYLFANETSVAKPWLYSGMKTKYISPSVSALGDRAVEAYTYGIGSQGRVPQGSILVLGDNRGVSQDSRHSGIGFIPLEDIVGEPWQVF